MIKEDESYSSPIATLFYEYYDSVSDLTTKLDKDADLIQCMVSKLDFKHTIDFGQTQQPKLSDFADDVDTIEFLLKI